MGLTIHYSLQSDATSQEEARRIVEALRHRALDLPFQSEGDVLEFEGDDCRIEHHEDAAHRWLLVQAMRLTESSEWYSEIAPNHVIAFIANPGDGSEPALFGLCRYPSEIESEQHGISGWTWSSFCKTQYASNPE